MGGFSERDLSKGNPPSPEDSRQALEKLQAAQQELGLARQELEQVRRQLAEYESLLGELPGIFERKYLQRQQPFELQQQLLFKENQSLREIVRTSRHLAATPPPPPAQAAALQPAALATNPAPGGVSRSDPSQTSPPPAKPWTVPAFSASLAAKGLAILFGFVALGAALGTLRQGLRQGQASASAPAPRPSLATSPEASQLAAPPQPARPKPALTKPLQTKPAAAKPAPNLLVLTSSEPNWVQVRSLNRQPVYEGMLKGEKILPLGQGLQVLAGRPDLLTVRQGASPVKQLGRIDQLNWFSFRPPAAPAVPSPATAAPP